MSATEPPGGAGAGPAVIDASIGLKWVLPESGSEDAVALRDALVARGAPLYVPELFWAETANVLWRLTRGAPVVLAPDEALGLLETLETSPLSTEPVRPLAVRAVEIACAAGITAYDASYVAVAELRGARLWTADRRLVDALADTPWGGLVAVA